MTGLVDRGLLAGHVPAGPGHDAGRQRGRGGHVPRPHDQPGGIDDALARRQQPGSLRGGRPAWLARLSGDWSRPRAGPVGGGRAMLGTGQTGRARGGGSSGATCQQQARAARRGGDRNSDDARSRAGGRDSNGARSRAGGQRPDIDVHAGGTQAPGGRFRTGENRRETRHRREGSTTAGCLPGSRTRSAEPREATGRVWLIGGTRRNGTRPGRRYLVRGRARPSLPRPPAGSGSSAGPGERAPDLVAGTFDLVLWHGAAMYLGDITPMLTALAG